MGWFGGTELIVVIAVLMACLAPFAWLFARRRWLSGRGGLFDCGLRSSERAGAHWTLGLARYEGDELRWYRAFGLTLRPALVLNRRTTHFVSQREPDAAEHLVLFSDHEVIRMRTGSGDGQGAIELAMTPASMTGLLGWLEASLPGGGRYYSAE